ncbi:hypothetical protein IWX76_002625 [Pedobacter sp. CAN_A7]|uniref:hypothetical protein n=1 Tax=Pedobacter sp. CAN_A7 TaxID=2787722 RepID=UPI0018CB074D
MKNLVLFTLLCASALFASCSQNNDGNKANEADAAKSDSLATTECYVAIDSNDKATLKLNTLGDGKVTGSLLIAYHEKGKNDGTLEGKFSGDTLFVDYTFKIGTDNPTEYKNPLAFLKKDGQLILGVGVIETYLGRSYFAKDKPIRFDQSKFIFDPATCEAK